MEDGSRTIRLPQAIRQACAEALAAGRPIGDTKAARVARIAIAVDGLNAIAASLPDTYHWRFTTAEAFLVKLDACRAKRGGAKEVNALYWRDTVATMEAYMVMSVWRMVDIADAALALVETDAIVPAAILARSALESAVQFVHDARTMAASLDHARTHDMATVTVMSEELEKFLLQTVYASRQTGTDPLYKSKNILTVIEKVAKVAKGDPIASEYEMLCELTHPNFLGRSVYFAGVQPKEIPGDEVRLISHRNGVNADAVLQSTLWALSWAIERQASSTHLIQSAIGDLFGAFPFLTKRTIN
ncbi:hypothetical protein P1X14_20155 [Sphingomonas sp. AOB5]|uniref:hypothetical protein n=1 Tax=Sphingomonas sp. AOB5 TaxID=3034017 RepID=UPI0023F83E87|nr:hypothetical protein [Sphingomonas sp. AOB5]MDF7777580.1 hypothetical protein [Sphingomonas sp. AOB5]